MGQNWRFEVEINRRCDLMAPQMKHEHAFPLLSCMIYSHQESVFVHKAGVSKQECGRVGGS